jgi:hypothetical protein
MSKLAMSINYLAITLFVAVASLVPPSMKATAFSPNTPHCVSEAAPIRSDLDQKQAVAKHIGCFKTFAEAIFVATDGTVHLDSSVTPETLTQDMLQPSATSSSVVIGVDYGAIEFNTGHGTHTWTGAQGPCSPTLGYGASSMPSGWNDAVSSARSYSDCNKYKHFEHTWSQGTSITCSQGDACRLMGYMDNKTSSETWSY